MLVGTGVDMSRYLISRIFMRRNGCRRSPLHAVLTSQPRRAVHYSSTNKAVEGFQEAMQMYELKFSKGSSKHRRSLCLQHMRSKPSVLRMSSPRRQGRVPSWRLGFPLTISPCMLRIDKSGVYN